MATVVVGVPGRFPLASFEQVGELLSCVLDAPATAGVLYFGLTAPLQAGVGAALYYSLPPYDTLDFLAVVANECPSQIVSTGFATKAKVQNCPECRLAVTFGPLEAFRELYVLTSERANHGDLAAKVAQNLYDFLRSFEPPTAAPNEALVVPRSAFDSWLKRFLARCKADPCFLDR